MDGGGQRSDKDACSGRAWTCVLNYWLAMRTGSEVSPTRVFDVFRGYVKDQDIHAAMSEVKKDLVNYRESNLAEDAA